MTIIAPVDLTFFIKFRISFLVKLSCLLLLLRKGILYVSGRKRLGTGSSVNDGTDYPYLERSEMSVYVREETSMHL